MPGKVAKIGTFSDWVGLFDDWRKEIGVNRDEIASFNFDTLYGAIETDDTPWGRSWRREWAYSRAATIYGGTSEIQKDIVASRLLGLPRIP